MSAAPHAYDDLHEVYAAETSARSLNGWLPLATDRDVNRRPSLNEYEATDPESDGPTHPDFGPETPGEVGPRRPTAERILRAAQSGGAANKARWARITAAKKALKEAA